MSKSSAGWNSRLWVAVVVMAALAAAAPVGAQTGAETPPARAPVALPAVSPVGGSGGTLGGGNPTSIIHRIHAANERIELSVDSSRILTLDQKIPWVQVNKPDVLEIHPLSPNEIQIFGKAPGVTQINLRTEDQKLYTIDAIVYADSQALLNTLRTLFPNATVRVLPLASGVILTGFVDQPEHVNKIVEIASEYYAHVINNMQVAGTQQVLLHVKVMEVSRTKLRQLGFDFAKAFNGNLIYSGAAGLISAATSSGVTATSQTMQASVVEANGAFFGVLQALRQDNLVKILAEPTLVTVSGRPAYFQSGGQIPILIPESLGTVTIDYKNYGTQIDFVPVVLGNGRIHLDVRPRVSEIDPTRSVTIGSFTVPGLRTREVETGVEMMAGQTLAIAGLVQTRVDAQNKGLPILSEVPYLGAAFRAVEEQSNEIELLIMVTPELAEAVNACDMPPGGPGLNSTSPNDCELFLKGHLEVPICNPTLRGAGPSPQWSMPADEQTLPASQPQAGKCQAPAGVAPEPVEPPLAPLPTEASGRRPTTGGSTLAPITEGTASGSPWTKPSDSPALQPPAPTPADMPGTRGPASARPAAAPQPAGRASDTPRPSTLAQPTPIQGDETLNLRRPVVPSAPATASPSAEPAFLGPVGYDVK